MDFSFQLAFKQFYERFSVWSWFLEIILKYIVSMIQEVTGKHIKHWIQPSYLMSSRLYKWVIVIKTCPRVIKGFGRKTLLEKTFLGENITSFVLRTSSCHQWRSWGCQLVIHYCLKTLTLWQKFSVMQWILGTYNKTGFFHESYLRLLYCECWNSISSIFDGFTSLWKA